MKPSKKRQHRIALPGPLVGAVVALLVPALSGVSPASATGALPATSAVSAAGAVSATGEAARVCAPTPAPPDYYAIDLVTTKNVPGTAYIRGTADFTFAPSPFGVAVAPDGSYVLDVHLTLEGLREPAAGGYVAWVTTSQVDRIRRLGPLENGRASGRVHWNKFLVVVTLEEDPEAEAERWSGPVAFRGMSRSGKMHTMAGHGPFQQENCAAYGYED